MADLSSLSDQQLEQYRQVLTQSKPEVHTHFGVVGDALAGAGGEVAQHAVNIYDMLRKIPGADKLLPDSAAFHQAISDATPSNMPAHVGKFLENTIEFMVPAGKAASLTKGAGLATRMAAQAGAAGGARAVQGGNTGEVADAAALGAAGPIVGDAAGYLTPKLTAMAQKVGPAVRDAAADIVGIQYPKVANAIRALGKIAEKTAQTPPAVVNPAATGVAVASSPMAAEPASMTALRTPEQRSAAQALADEMLKHGSISEAHLSVPEAGAAPDAEALGPMMRDLPAGAPKAVAKANYAGNQEPQQAGIVYDAAGRAAKSQNLATMFHDEGLASKEIANWDIKKLNAAARDRGMKTPFSMKSFGELVQQLRKMEGSK